MKSKLMYLFLLAVCLIAYNCTQTVTGGGGSDIPNGNLTAGINGNVIEISSSVESMVYVYSADYEPFKRFAVTESLLVTDDTTSRITMPDSGQYTISAIAINYNAGAFIPDIPVRAGNGTAQRSARFKILGSLSGTTKEESDSSPMDSVTVCLLGTPFNVQSDQRGNFHFSSIPQGTYTVNALKYLPCGNNLCDAVLRADTVIAEVYTVNDELELYLK